MWKTKYKECWWEQKEFKDYETSLHRGANSFYKENKPRVTDS